MQIICISRGSFGHGKTLAQRLAAKLDYECLGREELTDQATMQGIPVGRIETAVVKRQPLNEALALQVDRFKAFITATLCEKALNGGVVYHGRAGHLILPGLTQVLRVRAIADLEERIDLAVARTRLSREKATEYVERVDDDIRRWVRILYNVDWEAPSLYHLTLNASHLSIESSSAALVQVAQMPELQPTPAYRNALLDLLLTARCRLALANDERTRETGVSVSAQRGQVTVTYPPRSGKQAEFIPSALERVSGIEALVCTVATTNILYIQERFDPEAASFGHLIEVAEKWNAAVELVRLASRGDERSRASTEAPSAPVASSGDRDNGGILDDVVERPDCEESGCGVPETVEKLIQVGRAGPIRAVYGGAQELGASLSRTESYSLVVVGDVFMHLGEAVRKRQKRDLMSFLTDQLHVPVLGAEELKAQYLFGPAQWAKLAGLAVTTVVLYFLAFTFQAPILDFLVMPGTAHRVIAATAVALFAPVAATVIGGLAHSLLRLAKLE